MKTTVKINGMSCVNCVRHVTEALEGLPGVSEVKVDLASGEATFQKADSVSMEQVASAVSEAGYQLAQ